ncbi:MULTISPECIES: hypothetical protein [unclassified Pantoea]|uniref:hypothetical protein n=1 Tax=unclassified Pantoea TaxID=2630326 RepID=UPI001FAA9791|nr:hypothetical protein [Pantoea sp. MQR6]
MAQSISDIQKKSDEKRGVKVKGIKLHMNVIELLERLANETGESQAAVVTKALQMYAENLSK